MRRILCFRGLCFASLWKHTEGGALRDCVLESDSFAADEVELRTVFDSDRIL